MVSIPSVFRRFIPQLFHIIVLPVFFFAFMLIYRAFDIEAFLAYEWFGVHLTIISCILFLSLLLTRLAFFFIPLRINYALYILWCFAEMLFSSFFVALYIWLVMDKPMPYFDVQATSIQYVFFTLIFPYIILSLSLRIYDYHKCQSDPEQTAVKRMRFYDSHHNLKFVLMPQSVLYISAEENYVGIYYMEGGKVKDYVLRSSMKAIEDLCHDNGLVRCHRSFYINPAHIRILRKDKDGVMYAEMNADDVRHIPVSKTFYSKLSEAL